MLKAGQKRVEDLPQLSGNLHGNMSIGITYILNICTYLSCMFYHARAIKMDTYFANQMCKVLETEMNGIWRKGGVAHIQLQTH